ncbi:MAG: 5-oxoprolinase subunit PxpB [Saprospiraceae bacterium]
MTSLGDSALLVDFGNVISKELNGIVITLFNDLNKNPFDGMIEAVPAFSSLAIYYNLITLRKKVQSANSIFAFVSELIEERIEKLEIKNLPSGKLLRIPVCYDDRFGVDLKNVAEHAGILPEEIIQLHSSRIYHVFMIGFLPGFPYMGELDDRICLPRKANPVNVSAGSVGIAGRQTGIYPFHSPGGWQIIGRTPLNIFVKEKKPPVLLAAGDQVQFYPISYDEFENYQSGNF